MAKRRVSETVKLSGYARRSRRALMVTTALQGGVALILAFPPHPVRAQPAPYAHPTGGSVVVGAATITQTQTNTVVSQPASSPRTAVNWQGFDVGSQHTVTFRQPSSSALVLNRVVGPDPSQIAGKIDANGQIAIVNQSGVVFYKGSQVNAASVLVSAPGITNQNFAAGRMVFDQAPKPNARIVNAGQITVKQAGLAAFVAPQVANSGVITAKLGRVVLAGATAETVDMYGDGLLSIDVTGQVKQAPIGPNGKLAKALVTNTGVIAADGGSITLTAAAADGIVQNLVAASGTLQANTVGNKVGTIRIAGIGGSITVDGVVSAQGTAPGSTGGQIALNATRAVKLGGRAQVNASGAAGGGVIAVGTTLARAKGGPSVKPRLTAKGTVIQRGAVISADATQSGNGGHVTVLSTKVTNEKGTITARGGTQGGNGGLVEVSGEAGYSLSGSVDVGAANGAAGSILIDPTNLTITSDGTSVSGSVFYNTFGTGNATISAASVDALTGNVTLQATNDITVDAALSLIATSFTMEAGNNIAIDAPISDSGAITITAAAPDAPNVNATGSITIGANSNVNSTGGAVNLTAGTNGITIQSDITGVTVTLTSAGSITQDTNTTVTGTGTGAPSAVTFTANGGSITQQPGAVITATDPNGSINLTASGGIAFGGTIQTVSATSGGAGLVQLTANGGDITETVPGTTPTGVLATPQIGAFATGNVVLNTPTGAGNQVGTINGLVANGSVDFIDTSNLTVAANVSGTTVNLQTSGDIAINQNTTIQGTAPGSAVTLSAGGAITADTNTLITATDPAGNVSLAAGSGITFGGEIETATGTGTTGSVTLNSTNGDITETLPGTNTPAGFVVTPVLTGAAGGNVILAGTNQVSALGDLSGQTITLNDVGDLSVPASVSGGTSVTITDSGTLDVSGLVSAPTVSLNATGDITETGGINAGTLSGSAGGSATLTGLNQVTDFNNFTAGGDLLFLNLGDLFVTGTVQSTGGNVEITADPTLTESGTVPPPQPGLAGNLTQEVGSVIEAADQAGSVSLLAAGSITIGGQVRTVPASQGGTGQVSLLASGGGIAETGGGLIATPLLTGSAGYNDGVASTLAGAALTGPNLITNLGSFATTGSLSLVDDQELSVTGIVSAGISASPIFEGGVTLDVTGTGAPGRCSGSPTTSPPMQAARSIRVSC